MFTNQNRKSIFTLFSHYNLSYAHFQIILTLKLHPKCISTYQSLIVAKVSRIDFVRLFPFIYSFLAFTFANKYICMFVCMCIGILTTSHEQCTADLKRGAQWVVTKYRAFMRLYVCGLCFALLLSPLLLGVLY